MTEYVLPPVTPNSCEWTLHDYTGVQESVLTGNLRTVSRGQRWACKVSWHDLKAADRAALASFVAQMRGKANRAWLNDPSYVQRGSFPGGELFANAAFNGTASWSSSNASLSSRNGSLRVTALAPGIFYAYQSAVAVTQYAPHVVRSLLGSATPNTLALSMGPAFTTSNYAVGAGLRTLSGVPLTSSVQADPGVFNAASGSPQMAGDWGEIDYTTLQRCALVDNGPNLLTWSDALDTATSGSAWTKAQTTIIANARTAPDGTVTGDSIFETAVTNSFSVYQQYVKAAVAADYCFTGAVHAGSGASARNFAFFYITDLGGSNQVTVSINLTTGAIVSAVAAIGTFSNGRAFVASLGNGWWQVSVIANISAATTTMYARVLMSTDGSTVSYAGSTTADIAAWRLTLAQSSVPVTLTQTQSTALPAGTSPVGSAVNVKGLPVSTAGLVLAGDMLDINGELKRAISDLDSNASGLGYLQFEPSLRSSGTADGAPIVIGDPIGKFVMSNEPVQETRPGGFSDFEIEFIEAA